MTTPQIPANPAARLTAASSRHCALGALAVFVLLALPGCATDGAPGFFSWMPGAGGGAESPKADPGAAMLRWGSGAMMLAGLLLTGIAAYRLNPPRMARGATLIGLGLLGLLVADWWEAWKLWIVLGVVVTLVVVAWETIADIPLMARLLSRFQRSRPSAS